ncbi:MAG: S8/S53 family peptidase [Caulobacteraceae bacterium]|nr:S8/S53 family peptidase [Caulobacteraceae bacterium]
MVSSPLPGSEREKPPAAQDLGPADPAQQIEVSVLVRHANAQELKARAARLQAGQTDGGPLTRVGFEQAFGADPADIEAVRAFAEANGLAVTTVYPGRRTVKLSGTVGQFQTAFQTDLRRYSGAQGEFRGRTGALHLPEGLAGIVRAVLGLDTRPQARPHFRLRRSAVLPHAAAQATSYSPEQVAALYGFPTGVTGAGECVAIIELGGGFDPTDLDAYFQAQGVNPAPTVVAVLVDGASNSPGGGVNSADGEVDLDIEVVGAVAPGARIAVYFAPNTDQGFIDAVSTAAHDTTNKPSVISISWGGPESSWSQQSITALDEAFQAAATMGVTVCVASGDSGSSDGASGDNVDFPASSPHALACGGTSLSASGAQISSESVWNDGAQGGAGGGGVSTMFALPAFQQGLSATKTGGASSPLAMRGVPDVAGDADPETGYQVRIDGQDTVIGGTSAVAPLWSALIALVNQARGTPVGYPHAQLYATPAAFNDITQGNNGDFQATPGWDACTGLGSPKGAAIAALLAPPATSG